MHRIQRLAFCLLAIACAPPCPPQRRAGRRKPITMVVPFPPGPALDLVARPVGAKLADALGQPVVVENRTGANGTLGSNAVARAAPDGYTLLAATAGTHVTAVHLMKNLPYDPVKDFTPIIAAVEPVTCLVVTARCRSIRCGARSPTPRRGPASCRYGSSGVGSVFHLMGELFNQTAGVQITHVPYRGVAPAMQDVIGGHIPMAFISVSNALALGDDRPGQDPRGARAGALLAAAADSPRCRRSSRRSRSRRRGSASSVPPDCRRRSWRGSTPRSVKALNAPDVSRKLEDNGIAVIGGTPEHSRALIADGIARYGAIIKAAGIQPE